jgi:hypothetical protein
LSQQYSELDGYTLVFLNPSENTIPYFHTYDWASTDSDTGKRFLQEGMMGFGGLDRLYFIDLSAGPWAYPYQEFGEELFGQFHENKFTVKIQQEYNDLIVTYVNDAARLLFTPSYLFEPTYNTEYSLHVFIIDQSAGRSFANIAAQYVAESKVEEAMLNILPYAEWEIIVESSGFDYLPRDLQRAMINAMEFKLGEVVLIKSEKLIPEIDKFVKSEISTDVRTEDRRVSLPVIIFVTDPETYINDYGVIGEAFSDPADETRPCCVVIALDKKSLTEVGAGLTSVVVHEVSHLLGLMHPHDGLDEYGGIIQNWFFDWSLTPLTYSAPVMLGCGLTLTYPCGMVDVEYSAFNFDTLDRAIVLDLLRLTQRNVYEALIKVEELGYGSSELPENVGNSLSTTQDHFGKAKDNFIALNYFDTENSPINLFDAEKHTLDYFTGDYEPIDAVSFAFAALVSSNELFSIVNTLPAFVKEPTPEQPIGEPTEPEPVGGDISVAVKTKKKVTLVSVKNNGDEEIFGIKIKTDEGQIKFVKARGWERDRIDKSTVVVQTDDKPVRPRQSLILMLVADSTQSFEWSVLDVYGRVIANGIALPRS